MSTKEMKKKVLIGLIIFLLVTGTILFLVFKYTNLLLTKKQIFWKYAIKNGEIAQLFNSDEMKEFRQKKSNNSYKQSSKIKVYDDNDIYQITSETNAKNSSDMYTYAVLEKNSEKIIDAKCVKKSNLFGVKIDELADGYITIKNNNLKDLATKMGIQDVELIPDSINSCNYLELLEISDDDASYMSKKYSKLLMSKTSGKNYEKLENTQIKIANEVYDVQAYRFTLSENEMKDLSTTFCKTLSEDSRTLNLISTKMKLANFPDKYTSINYLSDKCVEISNRIDSIKTTDEEFIQITVYINGQDLIQTDVKFRDENLVKIIYNKKENSLSIQQDLLNRSNKFILSISDALDYALSKVKSVTVKTQVTDDKNKVITNVDIQCENNLNISYEAETEITDKIIDKDDYESSKKVILNDLSQEKLEYLFKALVETAKSIYSEKVNKLTANNTDNQNINDQELNADNQNENVDDQNENVDNQDENIENQDDEDNEENQTSDELDEDSI